MFKKKQKPINPKGKIFKNIFILLESKIKNILK